MLLAEELGWPVSVHYTTAKAHDKSFSIPTHILEPDDHKAFWRYFVVNVRAHAVNKSGVYLQREIQ